MKTIVLNTSIEAKNTKLDGLFKAPFDSSSLLWIDSGLPNLRENVQIIKQNLLEAVDTVDKDYQLIVLVDLYAFPMGNNKKTVDVYRMLIERYICCNLAEPLYKECNLIPQGICIFFVDSAKEIQNLDVHLLANNIKVQEAQEVAAFMRQEEILSNSQSGEDLTDEIPMVSKPARRRTEHEQIIMDLFGWTETMENDQFSWSLKISESGNDSLDFTEVFKETAVSVVKSHRTAKVLEIALQGVQAPREEWQFSCVGRFPIYTLVHFVSRENEQSKLEGFFCVFADIFTCVQEKKLISQVTVMDKARIREILVDALKKYKYFSQEDNIKVEFEPIVKVFEQRKAIFDERKRNARNKTAFKDMSDEAIADKVISMHKPVYSTLQNRKLRGLDRIFYELAEQIFGNYDTEVIRAQNNYIVKSCLEGLWNWRDKQTRETFKAIVDSKVEGTATGEPAKQKREALAFLQEEYEAERDALLIKVTDAENKLVANSNILLEAKDLMLQYSDWMRKGMWSWVSFIGAVFTVIATVFPFFYTEYSIGNAGLGLQVKTLALVGIFAFLYAVAANMYIAYIKRNKNALIKKLNDLRISSEEERKASIIALFRYYNDTIVEAESYSLLWREILRRDQENAKKGIKRNYHIKRLKNLAEQVERFITMLKMDVPSNAADTNDQTLYAQQGLQINGEESYYQQDNRRVYCLLPEPDATSSKKGDMEEA